MNKNISLQIPI